MSKYDRRFFESAARGSIPSARIVLPLVRQLYHFNSVIDVGCANGPWASVVAELGVPDCDGLDGDYVPLDLLLMPKERFLPHDLEKPIDLDRTYDLALCIEVAEHLTVARAPSLVADLCDLAPVVLFSAAIPGQGGTGHINEQWQDYWIRLFEKRGHVALDIIRRRLWETDGFAGIYKQNMFLMCSQNLLDGHPMLRKAFEDTDQRLARVIHPEVFYSAKIISYAEDVSPRQVIGAIPASIRGFLRRKLGAK